MGSEPYVSRQEMSQFEKRMDDYNLNLKEDISALTGNVKELVNTVQQLVVNSAETNKIWETTVKSFNENINDLEVRTKELERDQIELKKLLTEAKDKTMLLESEVNTLVIERKDRLDRRKWLFRLLVASSVSLGFTALWFSIKDKIFT